jgi:hypothetical protein
MTTLFQSVADESNRQRSGGEAVLERMSDRLFVAVLRRDGESLPVDQTGGVAGMRDPVVGRALSRPHETPAEA